MANGSELHTLIVDDEDDMRSLVRSTIEIANEGLRVGEVGSLCIAPSGTARVPYAVVACAAPRVTKL